MTRPISILDLTCQLIERNSITPEDAGCQTLLAEYLQKLGFECQHLPFGKVSNLWARHGKQTPLLVFAGHTDVVPPGPLEEWRTPPFQATVEDGIIYGRGAADMKGSLAAMLNASEKFINQHPKFDGSLAFLITSDEEGDAIDGTAKVIQHLQIQNEKINWCVVGEPSSSQRLGDVVRNGRRGSMSGLLKILGQQGHVAYPHLADNAIHACLSPLQALIAETWDMGNEFFPATSFQISNLHAGTGAHNVIPGSAEILFNFRFSTAVSAAELQQRVTQILQTFKTRHELRWHLFGEPFFTAPGALTETASDAIYQVCGYRPEFSTGGGTSDGRFIAPTGAEVIELGPINASIHKTNEQVKLADLELLSEIYYRIMHRLLIKP